MFFCSHVGVVRTSDVPPLQNRWVGAAQEEGVAECDAASDAGMSQPETDVLSFEEKEGQEGQMEGL